MNRGYVLYWSVGLALIAAWFLAIYAPFQKQHQQVAAEIAQAESQLEDFRATISELPHYIERHLALLNQRNDLNSKLYTKKDVLRLFEELEFEALDKHVTVTEITPPIEELLYLNTIIPDSGTPQFLNIGLKLEGDFVGFGRFVRDIEQADYFRGINMCKVYGHPDDKTKIIMQFNFKALLGNFRDKV